MSLANHHLLDEIKPNIKLYKMYEIIYYALCKNKPMPRLVAMVAKFLMQKKSEQYLSYFFKYYYYYFINNKGEQHKLLKKRCGATGLLQTICVIKFFMCKEK